MANNVARLPIDYFPDPTKGRPVFNGQVFIGEPDKDPEIEANRKAVTLRQEDGTEVPVTTKGQPFITGAGGVILYNGSPVQIIADGDYSIKVLNAKGAQVYFVENALSNGTANNISYDSGCTDGVLTTVQDELRRSLSVDGCGADPTGVLDSATAIRNAILYAAANNIPRVVGQGTYKVDLSAYINDSFAAFSNVDGLEIDFSAATINDVTTYSTTIAQTVKFIHPTDSTGIHFKIGNWTADVHSVIPSTAPRDLGAYIMYCENKCVDCFVSGSVEGAFSSFTAFRDGTSDPLVTMGNKLCAYVNVTGVHYPYNLQNNGDNAEGFITGKTVGRAHFVYGVDHVQINDNCRNTLKQSLIDTFEGNETATITARVTDVDSDDGLTAAVRCGLRFGDQTPSKLTNIHYIMNVRGTAAGDFGHILEIGKYDNGGSPDSTQRGHELKGLIIEGVMDTTLQSGKKPFIQIGQLTGTDVVSGVEFRNLTHLGGNSNLQFDTYDGGIALNNVNAGSTSLNIMNAEGTVAAKGCVAESFTGSVSDASKHTYTDCVIADAGSTQNRNDNKNFINTSVKGFLYNSAADILSSATTSVLLEGDLSLAQNVFKIPASAQISGTIVYDAVSDQSNLNPGTRGEEYGKTNFAAALNSSGVWNVFLAFAPEGVTRAVNSAATVTFAFVNGDANGGFISFLAAGTGYNVANSRAVIKIDALSLTKAPIQEA